ncbi:MAG: ABC transporter permease [Chloroflexi bacterium]|nr:ABC transporter permease [Chloroflexota bacterium]
MSEGVTRQDSPPAAAAAVPSQSFSQTLRRFLSARELGPLILLLIQVAIFAVNDPGFYSPLNISNMLAFVPELGIIALGMTLLLTAGEFDLSVGSVFAFCQVVMFILFHDGIMSLELAFVVVLLLAALNGFIIGVLVTKVHISSFLVTLGMMLIVRGTVLYITGGVSRATFGEIETPLTGILVGIFEVGDFKFYNSLLWFLSLAAVLHFILTQTPFGNWIMATGGNAQAARARGVDTDRAKIILFMLTSVLAGFAGIISALRLSTAYPVAGDGYELEVIAMTVIGGTLLLGGRGTIIGTLIGTLLLRTMRNGIIFVGIPGLAYDIFIGLIIIFMMIIHQFLERRARMGER